MIKLWRFLSVPIVLAVCLGLLLVPALPTALAVGGIGVEVQPQITKVGFSEDFSVDINIVANATQSYDSIGMRLVYDTQYVNATDATDAGTFDWVLTPPDYNNTWSATQGLIRFDASNMGGPINGSNPVISVNFTTTSNVANSGVSGLDFIYIVAADATSIKLAMGDVLDWDEVVNGTVEVGTTLTVNVTPSGKGTVEANGVTLTNYPNTTGRAWDENVTLEAFPVGGYIFLNWSGEISGSADANPSYVIMDDFTKNVTANFYGQEPEISPDPSSLTFSANVGVNPANQTLDIRNGGGGILNWTANITGVNATDWLSMSPKNGTNLTAGAYNSTQVAVNTTDLPMGTYYANITINSTDTAENVTVPVTLNLGVPAISTSTTSLTFTTSEGEDPPDQTLEVCNSGTGTLDWSLTDNAGWLSESPTSGSLAEGACEDVTVSVDVTGMAAGDYTATITITGSGVTIPVILHIVSAMPEISVGPAQLSASSLSITPQQVQPGQDVTISINVANTGGETGSYNAVLYINEVVEASQSVSVAAGTSKNVIFTVSKSQAGVYDVSVAGQNGQFEVVSTGWFGGGLGTGGIIAIVVIVIVLIVAVVFILRGTTRPE